MSAPGRTRTCDTRFRKPLLYPLSYEGAIAQVTYLRVLRYTRPSPVSAIRFGSVCGAHGEHTDPCPQDPLGDDSRSSPVVLGRARRT